MLGEQIEIMKVEGNFVMFFFLYWSIGEEDSKLNLSNICEKFNLAIPKGMGETKRCYWLFLLRMGKLCFIMLLKVVILKGAENS